MAPYFNILVLVGVLVGVVGLVSSFRMMYHVRPEAGGGWWSPAELLFRPSVLTERGRALRRTCLSCMALFVLLWLVGLVVAQFLPRESG